MIQANALAVGYSERLIVRAMDFHIAPGEMVAILGPNGSGKSTLLKAVARLLKVRGGTVLLDGEPVSGMHSKAVARKLAILAQVNAAPDDMTVERLVAFGRLPHRRWYEQDTTEDFGIIQNALEMTNMVPFAQRRLTTLSGGERQRAWIAMCLAQQPQALLLDEPTTYLDICHQYEVMSLLRRLNTELGMTIVMVLHDLNQALRFAGRVLVLKEGDLVASGDPEKVLSAPLIRNVYNLHVRVLREVNAGHSLIVPAEEEDHAS